MERSKVIFGNTIADKDYRKACKQKEKNKKKYGDDSGVNYTFAAADNPVLAPIGVKNLVLSDKGDLKLDEKAVIVGNIRMGYGHYRISMAIASAAHALGYTPYWLDLNSYPESTATKLISAQNDLYSLGSRLSQRFGLFNKLVWEPINSEGFRKLTYNAADQKNAELMAPLLKNLPKDVPYVATHAWPAQAAIHAGFTRVVNAIPDNWPMALHLSEGSIHTVQTPSAFLGYKMLRGMDPKRQLKPMPAGTLFDVGHYIDHELVVNIEADCAARLKRMEEGAPRRYFLSIGGAGAQQKLFEDIIRHLIPQIKQNKAMLLINTGDHFDVWNSIVSHIPELAGLYTTHFDNYDETKAFLDKDEGLEKIQVFCHKDIFAAVYVTNLLMRKCDVLLTKPSELSFYPVPKIMIHRVGGHEAWGAIRAAEVGDGTYELDKTEEVLAMLDEITNGKEILPALCRGILRANAAGIYNGAYEAVKLAVNAK
ncbi:MAG: hypothetical protein IJV41_13065 [Oscillospiraceae bacterium]|nr:hypothetical protein [Oscillospiraceae bacterium]